MKWCYCTFHDLKGKKHTHWYSGCWSIIYRFNHAHNGYCYHLYCYERLITTGYLIRSLKRIAEKLNSEVEDV